MSPFADYAPNIRIHFDPRLKYFVAEIPEIPTCAADAPTAAAAIAKLEETFDFLREQYRELGRTPPAPGSTAAIRGALADLRELADWCTSVAEDDAASNNDYERYTRRAAAVEVAIKELELRAPAPELEGSYPIVLYFGSREDADAFVRLIQSARPNLKSRRL